jgi:hypothetical protein
MTMLANKPWLPLATALVLALVGIFRLTLAQTAAPPARSAETPAAAAETPPAVEAKPPAADSPLDAQQAKLAAKYKDLERVFLRMAEVMQTTDPKRAALLRQAFAQSQEHGIDGKYVDLVKLLKDEQLFQATKGQAAVEQDLNRLLELLVSGDRDKQIPNERAEVKRFIERINKLIREQQGVQGETEGQAYRTPSGNQPRQVCSGEEEFLGWNVSLQMRGRPCGCRDHEPDCPQSCVWL